MSAARLTSGLLLSMKTGPDLYRFWAQYQFRPLNMKLVDGPGICLKGIGKLGLVDKDFQT